MFAVIAIEQCAKGHSMTLGRENVTFGKMVKYHDVMMLCFYTYFMLKMLYAHDSMMMSV